MGPKSALFCDVIFKIHIVDNTNIGIIIHVSQYWDNRDTLHIGMYTRQEILLPTPFCASCAIDSQKHTPEPRDESPRARGAAESQHRRPHSASSSQSTSSGSGSGSPSSSSSSLQDDWPGKQSRGVGSRRPGVRGWLTWAIMQGS